MRSVPNSASASCGREDRGRLVHDQDPRLAVERLQDLDALLLADGELPIARLRVHREPVPLDELLDTPLDHRVADEEARPSAR